jgi:hypothetical protein
MKRLLFPTGVLVLCTVLAWIGHLHAQSTQPGVCSVASMSGGYSYAVNGTVFAPGLVAYSSVIGTFTADGQGNLYGADTISENGTVQANRQFTGTYLVNSDCTGSVSADYSGTLASFTSVLSQSGNRIDFMQTGSGTVGTGVANRQIASPLISMIAQGR